MKDRCAFVLWSKLFLELNLCPAVSLLFVCPERAFFKHLEGHRTDLEMMNLLPLIE